MTGRSSRRGWAGTAPRGIAPEGIAPRPLRISAAGGAGKVERLRFKPSGDRSGKSVAVGVGGGSGVRRRMFLSAGYRLTSRNDRGTWLANRQKATRVLS